MSKILVVGATGMLGSNVCQLLTAEGKSVRGLIRASSDPVKVSRLQSLGVETIQGDVRDRASLDQACKGITHVISTVSSMPFSYQSGVNDIQTTDLDGVTNLIEAAKAKGVSHFTYTSFTGNMELDCPLRNAKREVERRLEASGLEYTILRPSYFMEAWLTPVVGFDAANAKATIYGAGHNPISWISLQDVARFAVTSLDHAAAKSATLELGGPEAIPPLEVVKRLEQINGPAFEVQFVPEEALEAQQAAATDPMQQSFSALMRVYAQGDPIDMTATLQTFAIQPTSLEDYLKHVLAPAEHHMSE